MFLGTKLNFLTKKIKDLKYLKANMYLSHCRGHDIIMVGMFGIVGIYMVGTKVENLDIKDCTPVLFTAGKQT